MKKSRQLSTFRAFALSAMILSISNVYAEDAASTANDKPEYNPRAIIK